jgi:lipopolysaccharide/colanic/teichoic acid biosynthesis glycosyltransferase
MIRRLFDLAFASVALAIFSVPCVLAAMAIKLTTRGPVLFRQERVGKAGRVFCFYKFRTMRLDNDGSQVTVDGDARVHGVGRWLRRTKLDELPQLWNVLKGDMSVIGPRPEVPRFVAQYTDAQRKILDVKPGLASLAQLVYPHEADMLSKTADPELAYVRQLMPRKISADLSYERNRTFWSDLRLIAELCLLVAGQRTRVDGEFSITTAGGPSQ